VLGRYPPAEHSKNRKFHCATSELLETAVSQLSDTELYQQIRPTSSHPAKRIITGMERPFGELVATIVGGTFSIFMVAIMHLRWWRKRQLRRVNHQLDEVLANSTKNCGERSAAVYVENSRITATTDPIMRSHNFVPLSLAFSDALDSNSVTTSMPSTLRPLTDHHC
jgi:hypothetical protein